MGGRFAQLGSSLFASTKDAFEHVQERLNKELDTVEAYLNEAPQGTQRVARQSSRWGLRVRLDC